MSEHRLLFDQSANSVDAIQRAAYRFSDKASCDIAAAEGEIQVTIHVNGKVEDPATFLADFRNEVLDQVLRERIRAETSDIRNLVLALAVSKTGLTESDV